MTRKPKQFSWIPWDVSAWRTDIHVRRMPWAVRAYYAELLWVQADEGWIPDTPEECALVIGAPVDEVVAAWEKHIRPRFAPCGPGALHNVKLAAIAEEQMRRAESSRVNGAKGGRPKKTQEKPNGIPAGVPNGEPRNNHNRHRIIDIETLVEAEADTVETLDKSSVGALSSATVEPNENPTGYSGEEPRVDDGGGDPDTGGALVLEHEEPSAKRSRRPTQPTLPLHADKHQAAYAILDAVWPMMDARHGKDLIGGRQRWRQKNKTAALVLAGDDKSPAQVCAALKVAFDHPVAQERQLDRIQSLSVLIDKWGILRGIRDGSVKPFNTTTISPGEREGAQRRAARAGVEHGI